MAYCIYLRKSRSDVEAEMRGDGETLERHKSCLLDLAEKLGFSITKIHSEIVSGETISARPVMQTLLTEVEQGIWKGVLVMEVERLARGDTIDQGIVSQAFKYSNTKIITPIKIYDPSNEFDEEYFEFGLFMSRREYKVINRRLQRGRIASVNEGKYLGNKAPYGYTRVKISGDKGYTLEINSNESEIVKFIYNLYTCGEKNEDGTFTRCGMGTIARRLNELKIPSQHGGFWSLSTIRGILENPVYIGKIRWNARPQVKKVVNGHIEYQRPRVKREDWILTTGLHNVIVNEEVWNKAQELLAQNPSRPCPKDQTVKNPLSGLIICGMCGRNMVRRPYTKKSAPDTLLCNTQGCKNVSSILSMVEEQLIQALDKWLINYKLDLKNSYAKNINSSDFSDIDIKKKSLKKIDEDIQNTEKQLNNIHDLLEQGIYDIEKFLERTKLLSDKCDLLKNQKQEIIGQIEKIKKLETDNVLIIPKIEKIIELYKKSDDPAIKNELLSQIVDKAVYTRKKGGRWHVDPTNFELLLYPKLPKI